MHHIADLPAVTDAAAGNGNGKRPPLSDDRAWPILDRLALQGVAGEIVGALEPHTEADPAALLVSLLAGFGSAVGAGPGAMADSAWHSGRLFVCIVGATAKARKGTSWRNVARVLEVADEGWAHTRVKSGMSSGEGLIAAVADPVIGADGETVSAGCADKRLLVIEEEFSRVLQVAKREASTLSAVVRQAYDTGTLSVLTKVAQAASGAHISILGHITTEELRAKLTDTDVANGLANRFLFVCVRRSKLLAESPGVDHRVVSTLGAKAAHALQAARPRGVIGRTPAASELWGRLYQDMADDDPGGLLGAVVARPEAQTLRLSLLYAMLDGADTVDLAHLQAAWALWQYCRQSAEYIFGDAEGDEHADKLLRAIRAAGSAGSDGSKQHKLLPHCGAGQRQTLRNRLEAAGKIRNVVEDTGGRRRVISFDTRMPREHP